MFPHTITSGGQTGVDRAALDFALEVGIPIGGHLPRGRKDENGDVLPDKYADMQETDSDDVKVRTELLTFRIVMQCFYATAGPRVLGKSGCLVGWEDFNVLHSFPEGQ